jgi:hypothetical protein
MRPRDTGGNRRHWLCRYGLAAHEIVPAINFNRTGIESREMTITQPIHPLTSAGDNDLDPAAERKLCETCYELIVDFGVQNVLACLGRVTRVRASDYRDADRRQYLRHNRAASRIMLAYQQVSEDPEQIDRIIAQEQRPVHVR